ncbi:MAG: Trk system potassium transporter TrkA, partial [Nitrospirota bacterium]
MLAIIVGAGEVGFQIAKFLMMEAIDVVVIDKDPKKLERVSEALDVATIEADGASPSVMKEAGAEKADILLAVTDSDETNMITCMVAKAMFDIPRKIARIRNPEYYRNKTLLSPENLDIDPAISPEYEVAKAIIRLIETPFAIDVEEFEDGLVKVIGHKVAEGSALAGKKLSRLTASTDQKKFLVGIIDRAETTIIPTGEDRIKEGDVIYLPVKKWEVGDALSFLGVTSKPARKLMIVGGGRIGHYIASALEDRASVKIIENDFERSKYLSKTLSKCTVLNGDGSDQNLLLEENVGDMDVFAAVTNNEELNIMASLLAKRLGSRKTITLVNRTDYVSLALGLGLEAVMSPRLITASSILKFIRRGDILSLTAVAEERAEVLEARIGAGSALIGKSLAEAKLPIIRSTAIRIVIVRVRSFMFLSFPFEFFHLHNMLILL